MASISPAIQVAAQDAGGNPVSGYSGSITFAIANNPNSGTLSGTTTVSAFSGVSSFSGLSIDKAGNGYTLTASASGLSTRRAPRSTSPWAPPRSWFFGSA